MADKRASTAVSSDDFPRNCATCGDCGIESKPGHDRPIASEGVASRVCVYRLLPGSPTGGIGCPGREGVMPEFSGIVRIGGDDARVYRAKSDPTVGLQYERLRESRGLPLRQPAGERGIVFVSGVQARNLRPVRLAILLYASPSMARIENSLSPTPLAANQGRDGERFLLSHVGDDPPLSRHESFEVLVDPDDDTILRPSDWDGEPPIESDPCGWSVGTWRGVDEGFKCEVMLLDLDEEDVT
jgi:hypothetical protein